MSEPSPEARRLTMSVDHGGGAVGTIPDPRAWDNGGLEWCMRYAQSDRACLQAAAVVETFSYMLGNEIPAKEAIRRLRQMRRSFAAALAEMREP